MPGLRDGRAADHRERGADRHQHIGVIHGVSRAVESFESHRFIVELLGEFTQYVEIGARRQIHVSHARRPIEHQTAGSLEEFSVKLAIA